MSFKYLYIPADVCEPVKQLDASKSGGLKNDYVRKHAEKQFSTNKVDRERQRSEIAAQLVAKGVDPSKIEELLNTQSVERLAGNVEIITLCLPTPKNNYLSVSLYCDGNNAFKSGHHTQNKRATDVVRACGHHNTVVMGDCFIGRAIDDERIEWERTDFTIEELHLESTWIMEAAKANAGKNLNNYSTSGVLNSVQKDSVKKSEVNTAVNTVSEFTPTSAYVWTQDADEVEVRMKIPNGLLAKHLVVTIMPNHLYIGRKVKNQETEIAATMIEGVDSVFSGVMSAESSSACDSVLGARLYEKVNVGDSSWSVASEKEGRLLTINLAKYKTKASATNWAQLLA